MFITFSYQVLSDKYLNELSYNMKKTVRVRVISGPKCKKADSRLAKKTKQTHFY